MVTIEFLEDPANQGTVYRYREKRVFVHQFKRDWIRGTEWRQSILVRGVDESFEAEATVDELSLPVAAVDAVIIPAKGWRIATEVSYGTDVECFKTTPITSQGVGSLANPYGEGNHHRISWRRQWDVDLEKMTAKHKPTGFEMAFNPEAGGGYTAVIWSELPPFGPDGTLAMAQMFGLRELLKDGWEIFHTVMGKK